MQTPDANLPRKTVRQETGNKRVDVGETHTIRGTNQTNLQVFDQFIRRSSGDAYIPKLRYWKARKGEFLLGFPAEFSLSHDEAVNLHAVLAQGLAVAAQGEVGEFLTLSLPGSMGDLVSDQDPNAVAELVAPLLSGRGMLAALTRIPDARSLIVGIETAARVIELESGVQQLTAMLEGGVVDEQSYQDWCEEHWWAFGPVYVARDEVRTIAIGDNVDLLMERTSSGLRDVFELKRPDMPVINYDPSHKSYYWSSDSAKALGQCHRYLDALHEGAARGLRDNPRVVAYHPRASVVIGRSIDWDAEKNRQLHGLNSRLHGLAVMTYDDMLGQAKQMVKVLRLRIQEGTE